MIEASREGKESGSELGEIPQEGAERDGKGGDDDPTEFCKIDDIEGVWRKKGQMPNSRLFRTVKVLTEGAGEAVGPEKEYKVGRGEVEIDVPEES